MGLLGEYAQYTGLMLSPGQTIATFSATYPEIVGCNMLRYVVLACCDRLAGAMKPILFL